MRSSCLVCGTDPIAPLIDPGPQAICNRFLRGPSECEYTHAMVLGQCPACATVQIMTPVPPRELAPRFDWISYNEPEGHLERMTDLLCSLPGVTADTVVAGLSYKDDTTLRRFRERGFANTWRAEPVADLGHDRERAEIETVQELLTPEAARRMLGRHPKAGILLARHVLEHAHDTRRFLEAARMLAGSPGYIVFEAPDCRRSMEALDYTTLWEEHILYFTPETFKGFFGFLGLELARYEAYPYPFEHSLVAVARPTEGGAAPATAPGALEGEFALARRFAGSFAERKRAYREHFASFRKDKGKIALLGAGHLAATFINLFELAGLIEFVADDNPSKAGLLMPGSKLPILATSALYERDIRLCLLAVSAAAEEKVIAAHPEFVRRGGRLASIFPLSRHALAI